MFTYESTDFSLIGFLMALGARCVGINLRFFFDPHLSIIFNFHTVSYSVTRVVEETFILNLKSLRSFDNVKITDNFLKANSCTAASCRVSGGPCPS